MKEGDKKKEGGGKKQIAGSALCIGKEGREDRVRLRGFI